MASKYTEEQLNSLDRESLTRLFKVNRMIRYGLEPKENFSQEYENEDKMAFSLS